MFPSLCCLTGFRFIDEYLLMLKDRVILMRLTPLHHSYHRIDERHVDGREEGDRFTRDVVTCGESEYAGTINRYREVVLFAIVESACLLGVYNHAFLCPRPFATVRTTAVRLRRPTYR